MIMDDRVVNQNLGSFIPITIVFSRRNWSVIVFFMMLVPKIKHFGNSVIKAL